MRVCGCCCLCSKSSKVRKKRPFSNRRTMTSPQNDFEFKCSIKRSLLWRQSLLKMCLLCGRWRLSWTTNIKFFFPCLEVASKVQLTSTQATKTRHQFASVRKSKLLSWVRRRRLKKEPFFLSAFAVLLFLDTPAVPIGGLNRNDSYVKKYQWWPRKWLVFTCALLTLCYVNNGAAVKAGAKSCKNHFDLPSIIFWL